MGHILARKFQMSTPGKINFITFSDMSDFVMLFFASSSEDIIFVLRFVA